MSFDRIKPPEERLLSRRAGADADPDGRAALFTGAPGRPATGGALEGLAVRCSRCGAVSPLDARTALRAVLPLALVAPWRDHPVFAVCPSGRHRAWLKLTRADD